MHYFRYFPDTVQNFKIGSETYSTKMTDIMIRYRIRDLMAARQGTLLSYTWKDGDRPDLIAKEYYGSTDYTWVVYYSNEAYDQYLSFPKDYDVFYNYLFSKYADKGSSKAQILSYLYQTVDHFERTTDNLIIDVDTFLQLPDDQRKAVSLFEAENTLNEQNRYIKLLSESQLRSVVNALRSNLAALKV